MALLNVSELISLGPVTLAFLVAQAINYHHYIVDGVVWRRPVLARVSMAGAAGGR